MDVQTVNVAAQEVQPPPGGRSLGKALPMMGAADTQAAFQSLMASLMAPLLAMQTAQPMMAQTVAGDAQASMLTAVNTTSGQDQLLAQLNGQGALFANQGTAAQTASVTAPTTDLKSLFEATATPVAAKTAMPLQTVLQPNLPTDNIATLDALRALAAGQPTSTAPAEGAVVTNTAQASAATTVVAQVFNAEGEMQTGKPSTQKAEPAPAQTPLAAFTSNVNAGEQVQAAGTVKASNASPVQQIADQVQMTLDRGENSATIRLQPAELGGVRIRLQVQDGQVHLSIEAEKSGTGHLIDQQIGNLRQNLENSGVRVGDLAVLAGGRGHVSGSEAMQREAAQSLRTMQMEMGGNQFHQHQQQQHAQQQAAFAGQDGQQRQGRQFEMGGAPNGRNSGSVSGVSMSGVGGTRSAWQASSFVAVDYYA